jgi:hypothetical protein
MCGRGGFLARTSPHSGSAADAGPARSAARPYGLPGDSGDAARTPRNPPFHVATPGRERSDTPAPTVFRTGRMESPSTTGGRDVEVRAPSVRRTAVGRAPAVPGPSPALPAVHAPGGASAHGATGGPPVRHFGCPSGGRTTGGRRGRPPGPRCATGPGRPRDRPGGPTANPCAHGHRDGRLRERPRAHRPPRRPHRPAGRLPAGPPASAAAPAPPADGAPDRGRRPGLLRPAPRAPPPARRHASPPAVRSGEGTAGGGFRIARETADGAGSKGAAYHAGRPVRRQVGHRPPHVRVPGVRVRRGRGGGYRGRSRPGRWRER